MFSLYTMSKSFFQKKKRQAVLSKKEAARYPKITSSSALAEATRPIGRSNT
jgi:hypothetical protein